MRLLREDLSPRRAPERHRAELLPFRAWAPLDHANGTSGDAHTVGLPGRFGDAVHAQLAPLVAELGHARRDVERLAEEKGRLESMVAALTYENARLVDEIARLKQPGGTNPQPPGPVGGEVMPEFADEGGKARRSGGPLGRWTP